MNDLHKKTLAGAPAPAHGSEDVEKKISQAKAMLKTACSVHPYTIAYSGGKDSVVMHWLSKIAGIRLPLPLVYNSTTIDPPGTIPFVQRAGAQVIRPRISFLDLVERKGMPSMFRRFCCSELKERYISDYLLVGVRRSESVKRAQRYCDFEAVRSYTHKKQTLQLFPLLHFTGEDIAYCVNTYQLECHPLYYDATGKFHVERRLGCIGCPLQSDRGRADFLRYPGMLRQIIKRLIIYHRNHGRTEYDAYLEVIYHLFYSNHGYEKFLQTYRGLFDNDPKDFLERYFGL